MIDIEQLFFEKFEIKKIKQGYCDWDSDCPYSKRYDIICSRNCPYWKYSDMQYPKIADTILIKLLVILGNTTKLAIFLDNIKTKEDLKYQILDYCIDDVDKLKEQVKQLFKD